jgi:two-component system sensor histidine kinase YesM
MNHLAKNIDHWTRNINMRTKLLVIFYFVTLVPVGIISVLFYQNSTKALEKEIGTTTVEMARQVENRLESFIQETERIANIIHFDKDVQHFLLIDPSVHDPEQDQIILDIRKLLASIGSFRGDLRGIFIVNDQGNMVYDATSHVARRDYRFSEQLWFQNIKKGQGLQLLPVHSQTYVNGQPVVTFAIRLTQSTNYREIGTLLIDFDPRIIENMSKNIQLGETGYVFMMTPAWQPVNPDSRFPELLFRDSAFRRFFQQRSGFDIFDYNDGSTLVSFATSQLTGWKIVGMVPFDEVSSGVKSIRFTLLLIVITSFIVIFIITHYITRAITHPFRKLEKVMRNVEGGDFSVRVPTERKDEIGRLSFSFNHMLKQLSVLKEEVYLAQIREYKLNLLHKESEIKALQSQINPHFLYNTLNTLTCIGEVYKVEEVVKISKSLSQMFKYSIKGDQYTCLKEELFHVQSFIHIMQIRYPSRFDYSFHIPEHLYQAEVPKLIIQPIVENAFIHGMKSRKKIQLWLHVEHRDSCLVIRTSDDGIGIPEHKLKELKSLMAESLDFEGNTVEHIGLINILQRLYLHFGKQADLSIESTEGKGTIVEISLPYKECRGEEDV